MWCGHFLRSVGKILWVGARESSSNFSVLHVDKQNYCSNTSLTILLSLEYLERPLLLLGYKD